jgi:hypothetical protein
MGVSQTRDCLWPSGYDDSYPKIEPKLVQLFE